MSEFSTRSGAPTSLPPQAAGKFYPVKRDSLIRQIDRHLSVKVPHFSPKVIVSPHAGMPFCGDLIGSAFAAVQQSGQIIRSVALVGPSHQYPIKGCVLPAADNLTSLLGQSSIPPRERERLASVPDVTIDNGPFLGEHSLDVLIPWIHRAFGEIPILPVLVGDCSADLAGQIMPILWGGPDRLVIVSSDLSHFLTKDEATRRDLKTLAHLECMTHDNLVSADACGHAALRMLWSAARPLSMRVTRLSYETSARVTSDPKRVVGYGALVMEYDYSARLSDDYRSYLTETVRETIRSVVTNTPNNARRRQEFRGLDTSRATFVTINKSARLRGCIGSLAPHRPLIQDLMHNATSAALRDPRFAPIAAEELPELTVDISILGVPSPMQFQNEQDLIRQLNPGKDGLIFSSQGKRATYLPHVWSQISHPVQFLRSLKQKAGLDPKHWSDDVQVQRYGAEVFGDTHR